MGYTIKQKIEICLQSDANPLMTQIDLANWAMQKYNSTNPPSQTTISRILSSKNELLGSRESDFLLVRRRKVSNPLLRFVLTEWMTQAHWERIPVTTPIIQLTANAIWNKLPAKDKDGNGVFSHKWCNHFVKKLNVNLIGSPKAIENNLGLPLNKIWGLDEKVGLKSYICALIAKHNYSPKDMFTIDEFLLFYCVPLDQIFDVSSVDKGLSQTSNFSDFIITIMLGCNMDGSEKLNPLVVSKHESFDLSESTISTFHANPSYTLLSSHTLANKVSEAYQITYKYNNNKWITSSTFQDYLLTLDHKLESVSPDRNILIFLDDSSTHRLMNLEFKHIKLVYLENASKHNNPYTGLFNEMKFDYVPTSFGIVEEFKIVFRLQQYLEMINKQNNKAAVNDSLSPAARSDNLTAKGNDCGEILSEKDYQVPFIKAIEWIKRSWDSITHQKIYQAWRKANIIDTKKPWPSSDREVQAEAARIFQPLIESAETHDPHLAYNKLKNVMNYLNVVIPWELNELLGLVNERAKVSLNYASVDEMINSCALSEKNADLINDQMDRVFSDSIKKEDTGTGMGTWPSQGSNMLLETDFSTQNPASAQVPEGSGTRPLSSGAGHLLSSFQDKLPPMTMVPSARQRNNHGIESGHNSYSLSENRSSSMNALLLATSASNATNLEAPHPNISVMGAQRYGSAVLSSNLKRGQSELSYSNLQIDNETRSSNEEVRKRLKLPSSNAFGSPNLTPNNDPTFTQVSPANDNYKFPYSILNSSSGSSTSSTVEEDLASVLRKVIEATDNNGLKLSELALEELKFHLSKMQRKQNIDSWNESSA